MERPWSAQIELVEGCTRLCSFCGLNGIRDAPGGYKYMSEHVAETTARQLRDLSPECRIEFAMHGEPLVHPHAHKLIYMFRAYMPKAQIMVTTNGATLIKKMQERVEKLFASGVDFIVLDTYYPERDELRARAAELKAPVKVVDFYDDLAPKGDGPYRHHHGKMKNTVILMDDIGARDGEHPTRVLMNHAGSNPSKPAAPEPLKKTCTNPFREVTVAYDGNVNICCMDWKHEFVMGNVKGETLTQIWNGARFEAARAHLQSKDRGFAPCDKCDKGSGPRVGLLPKYAVPTDEQRAIVPKRGEQLVQIRPKR